MSRISNALIDKIIENALAKAGVTKALADWQEARDIWVERARIIVNGATDAEIEAAVAKVKKAHRQIPETVRVGPYQLVNRSNYLSLNLAGLSLRFNFPDIERRIVPVSRLAITADNPLCQEFYDSEAEKKALDDRAASISAAVRAACKSVTTVKKLLEAWPEAKELLPPDVEEAKINLPTLVVSDLNSMIGLPSDEEAKAA